MGKFNEELEKAGALMSLDELQPITTGARLVFSGGKAKVTDGCPSPKAYRRDSWSRESKNYREVEVLKGPGYRCPPQHQTLIRSSSKGSASTKRLLQAACRQSYR
jgi:hypothetical protein